MSAGATDSTETLAARRSRELRVGAFAVSWAPKANNKTQKKCVAKIIWLGRLRWRILALALRHRGRRGGAARFFGFRGWGGRDWSAARRIAGGRDRSRCWCR